MPSDPVFIFTDSDAQPLTDQIRIGGRPFDMGSGSTVAFRMRYRDSSDLKVDQPATITDSTTGQVSYDWQDVDIDEPGEFFAWWRVENTDGEEIDTDEFPVIVTQHAPGQRTLTGIVYRRARGILPETWAALEKSPIYGDSLLQERIEVIKLRLFGTTVLVEDEADYDIRVQQFLAKLTVIDIIPTAVEYWMNQYQTATIQGSQQEIVSYPDRISALWELYERLLAQVAQERPIIEDIIDLPQLTNSQHTPATSPGISDGFVTPLPNESFDDYAFPGKRSGVWGNYW